MIAIGEYHDWCVAHKRRVRQSDTAIQFFLLINIGYGMASRKIRVERDNVMC